jgi:DNA-binding CsgD family transcriptional regulator
MGLAKKSGAISTIAAIELQRAWVWTLGTDLDRALTTARQCQETAARLRMRRVEAMAASAWASALGIRADRQTVERAAAQAEDLMPGDPQNLASTWGHARVIAAIFNDDLRAAHEAVTTGIFYARQEPRTAPFLAWGFWALLQATLGADGRDALREARAAGAEVARWNRGCLAYAEAVLEGRDGDTDHAAELYAQGAEQFRPCAPWWNHALRQLIAPAALADGWGQPAAWLRHAIPDLEASGHARLASAGRGILRRAGEPVPRRGRGGTGIPDYLRSLGVTGREMEVLLLVGEGSSSSDIAARLIISPKTVETYISNLLTKTDRRNRRELIAFAASRLHARTRDCPGADLGRPAAFPGRPQPSGRPRPRAGRSASLPWIAGAP